MTRIFNKQFLMGASLTCGLFSGALCAHGETPGLDAEQLGITESVLHYCGPVDPDAAKKLQDKVAQLVKGASKEALAKARASETYKHAYELVNSFVAQVDEHNAKIACTDQWASK